MKVNWVVDKSILESRNTVGDLKQAIIDCGHNYYETQYIPFARPEEMDYGLPKFQKQPTILYGSIGFVQKCPFRYSPGSYGMNSFMNCNEYYTRIPSEWLLNYESIFIPFGIFAKNLDYFFDLFGEENLFIRPNSGFKTFTGFPVSRKEAAFEINSSMQLTSVLPSTICVISKVKNIKSEARFLIVDGHVVAGSTYRWNDILDIRSDYENAACVLATKMAWLKEWQPDTIYTCDVAMLDTGEAKIIEINAGSSSGLYAMSKKVVVNAISEQSIKDYNDFFGY
jgi:hypothetical protein